MKKSRVQISDHAITQYLERVLLVDVEGLRRKIGHAVDSAMIDELGLPSKVTISGVVFCLQGDTVTTCWPVKPQILKKLFSGK